MLSPWLDILVWDAAVLLAAVLLDLLLPEPPNALHPVVWMGKVTGTLRRVAPRHPVAGPTNAPKARRAVALTLDFLGRRDLDARLNLDSSLPRAKGMASSTADVAAAIGATAAALGTSFGPRQQADLALAVEPSDGVMLPGIALFDHLGGRIAQSLGQPPAMRVLALEFGDEIDTQ